MILIGEKLNGFIPAMARAIEARDELFVRRWARAQSEAGADYLDICACGAKGGDREALGWLMEIVQDEVDTPLSIDTPDADVMQWAMARARRPGLANSIALTEGKADCLLPAIVQTGFSCVALLIDNGVPESAEERLRVFDRLMRRVDAHSLAHDRVFIDPLVTSLAAHGESFRVFAETCRGIRAQNKNVHIVGGATNVSFGLPARKHVNRAFLALAMGAGMDSAICDVTNPDIMGIVAAGRALLGEDEMCAGYLQAFRDGKL